MMLLLQKPFADSRKKNGKKVFNYNSKSTAKQIYGG